MLFRRAKDFRFCRILVLPKRIGITFAMAGGRGVRSQRHLAPLTFSRSKAGKPEPRKPLNPSEDPFVEGTFYPFVFLGSLCSLL